MRYLYAIILACVLCSAEGADDNSVVIDNDRITLRIVPGDESRVIFEYVSDSGMRRAAEVVPVLRNGRELIAATDPRIEQGDNSVVSADVRYLLPEGGEASVVYSLEQEFEYICVDVSDPISGINLKMKSEALVVPDGIGEDVVLYPSSAAVEYLVPSDSAYAVNMLDEGGAVLAVIWSSDETSLRVSAFGSGYFDSVSIDLPEDGGLWIGAVAAPGIWHRATNDLADADGFVKLDWSPPFNARWVAAFRRDQGLIPQEQGQTETWFIPERKEKGHLGLPDGVTIIRRANWQGWSANLGGYIYPGYFTEGRMFLRFPGLTRPDVYDLSFDPLVYALRGGGDKRMLPANAVRRLLGDETYNGIRTVLAPRDRYPATCGVMDRIERMFYREEASEHREDIERRLARMDLFVLTHRERIYEYIAWRQRLKEQLDMLRGQNPALVSLIDEYDRDLSELEWMFAGSRDGIKTPEYAATLSQKVVALIDSDLDPEQQEQECRQLGRAIRIIGGGQDGLLGRMRMVVKAVRHKATTSLMESADPEEISFFEMIRTETAAVMRSRFKMEGK